ncbi:uncharacterized protein LOC108626027 [Ceratina calcarata]|uniref:Uncharacterized protein LOC108626027 n=1 Tax=Ceratina calcarata TaxID=156304 RepID=A0AAJ7S2S3_9HYME|nr:uncharacterized protein LOC108626027 [Ceratina calcarata]
MESFTVPNLSNNPSKTDLPHNENELSEETKQKESELCSLTPRTYNVPQSMHTRSNSLSPKNPTENTVCKEEHNHNWQHPYQKHLTEYSTKLVENIEDSKDTLEQLLLDNQNEYLLRELASARDALRLNISESRSTDKGKVKNEKKEKGVSSALASKRGSLSKLDNMVSLKIKKKKKKVHSSNSRSTVTTRDTNYMGKKEPKKRKQKNTLTNRHTYKPNQTSNEVVEIYHNKAVKGASASAIPSKHSKLDHRMNYINILTSSAMNKQQVAKAKCEENNYQHGRELDVNNVQNSQKQQDHSKQKTEGRNTNTNDANYNLEVSSAPLPPVDKCNSYKCQHAVMQASYCDPIVTHNYEMPTLSSKLKRVDRAYFARFHFRNIPFVVGNSMATSHNLGLNIQEVCKVLSVMKTKQPVAPGITPLLIRKISRGMRPPTFLVDQMNHNHRCKMSHMSNPQIQNMHMHSFLQNANMCWNDKRVDNYNLNPTIEQYQNLEENTNKFQNLQKKNDTRSDNQLHTTLNMTQMLHAGDNKMLKLFASQQNVKAHLEGPDIQSKIYQGVISDKHITDTSSISQSQDSKGIREVLINLHDQFEEMNAKYEKLQEKAKTCSDKDLEEKIQNLEKDLAAKEDEINAVVNLYKEVMSLKQQMRMLQEKNGYVCISTEIPLASNKFYTQMPFAQSKSCGSAFTHRCGHRKGSSVITNREPTSYRLAGLLRQIQTFQKQLTLSW